MHYLLTSFIDWQNRLQIWKYDWAIKIKLEIGQFNKINIKQSKWLSSIYCHSCKQNLRQLVKYAFGNK